MVAPVVADAVAKRPRKNRRSVLVSASTEIVAVAASVRYPKQSRMSLCQLPHVSAATAVSVPNVRNADEPEILMRGADKVAQVAIADSAENALQVGSSAILADAEIVPTANAPRKESAGDEKHLRAKAAAVVLTPVSTRWHPLGY